MKMTNDINASAIPEDKRAEFLAKAEQFANTINSDGGAFAIVQALLNAMLGGTALIVEGRLDGKPVRILGEPRNNGTVGMSTLAVLLDKDFDGERLKLEDGYGSAENPLVAMPLMPPNPTSVLASLMQASSVYGCGDPDCENCGGVLTMPEERVTAEAEGKADPVPAHLH